jgi:uncharacterized glyoxalase superfamily protein PhnB
MGNISPTLAVRDMKAAIDFYTNALGFKLGMTFPTIDSPEYADVSKDGMVLMLLPAENLGINKDEKLGTGVNLYMQIEKDIDAYYNELRKRGVKIVVDIRDEPFGIRDFTVEDPNGYLMTFNQCPQTVQATSVEEVDEVCDSCEVYVTTNCLSCGMPMTSPQDHGGGNRENQYCNRCCKPDGTLKSYDEVLAGMASFMMESRKMDKDAAEKAAREYLSMMPAWTGH